jgi:histidine phosphotransfer protein HptB
MCVAAVRAESFTVALISSSESSKSLPTAGLPAPGVLDAQALARLAALDPGGAAGLVRRVLGTYRVSLGRLLEQLQLARSELDLQGQRHVAHTLKSSSASVGALALSALCAEAEGRLRDGAGSESLGPLLDALAAEGRRLLTALGEA